MHIQYRDINKNLLKIFHTIREREQFSIAISGYRAKIAKKFIPIHMSYEKPDYSLGLLGHIKYIYYSMLLLKLGGILQMATIEPTDIETCEDDGTLIVLFVPNDDEADTETICNMCIEYKDINENLLKILNGIRDREPFSIRISGYRAKIASKYIPIRRRYMMSGYKFKLIESIKRVVFGLLVAKFSPVLTRAIAQSIEIQTRQEDGTLIVLFDLPPFSRTLS